MTRPTPRLFLSLLALTIVAACDQADCPLDNSVTYSLHFYSQGERVQLNDALTVATLGTDSVLVNQMSGAQSIELPMSYARQADTLLLTIKSTEQEWKDTLWVEKTSTPHFDSPDCPTNMFHHITSVASTHHTISHVVLKNPEVNYANVENIQIHFAPSAQ